MDRFQLQSVELEWGVLLWSIPCKIGTVPTEIQEWHMGPQEGGRDEIRLIAIPLGKYTEGSLTARYQVEFTGVMKLLQKLAAPGGPLLGPYLNHPKISGAVVFCQAEYLGPLALLEALQKAVDDPTSDFIEVGIPRLPREEPPKGLSGEELARWEKQQYEEQKTAILSVFEVFERWVSDDYKKHVRMLRGEVPFVPYAAIEVEAEPFWQKKKNRLIGIGVLMIAALVATGGLFLFGSKFAHLGVVASALIAFGFVHACFM